MNIANVDSREVLDGYFGVALGKRGNPNMTYFRKQPKVKGKAAVKAAKRARQRARRRPQQIEIAA